MTNSYEGTPDYAYQSKPKLKRVTLAIFLCGLAACVSVAIIGALFLFAMSMMGFTVNGVGSTEVVIAGMLFAFMVSALNWFVFYLSIPAAWLALGFSIGHLPRRGITKRIAYFRWGGIWGTILVAGTTSILSGFIIEQSLLAGMGGLIGGVIVGMPAGLICAWLFLAIVRPAEQIKREQVEVF